MTEHLREALKAAVVYAVEDLAELSRIPLRDVLPKENQPQCAMFAFFKGRGCIVQAEATYPKGRGKCDLRVWFPSGGELWIELKNAWSASGWVNKPTEQRARWLADLRKLRQAPEGAHRAFVLVGYFDDEPATSNRRVPKMIYDFHPSQRIYDFGCRDFSWRLANLKNIEAWAWAFSTEELQQALGKR